MFVAKVWTGVLKIHGNRRGIKAISDLERIVAHAIVNANMPEGSGQNTNVRFNTGDVDKE